MRADTVSAKWVESRSRWQVNVQANGIRKTFVSSAPGRRGRVEAEGKASEWLESQYDKDMRFTDHWKEFLGSVAGKNRFGARSESYIKHEQIGRLWILPVLQRKQLSKLTLADYEKCVLAPYHKGKSKRTCENVRASLTACWRFARKNRRVMEQPEFITIPDDAPVGVRHVLQPNDFKTLFSQDQVRYYNKLRQAEYIHTWRFLVLTGLRRGELCALHKVDVVDGVVHVEQAINRLGQETKGKNKNARRDFMLIPLAQIEIVQQGQQMAKRGIISPYLFCDEDGDRIDPNRLYKAWLKYREEHGIKSSLHELRHTFVSANKSDMPEALMKLIVGHSASMDTNGVYGHEMDGDLARAAEISERVFEKLIK